MRIFAGLLLLGTAFGGGFAVADDCLVSGPRPSLEAESIDWQLVIASGQRCVRGLRANTMVLDNVRISTPAQFGQATAAGYGFVYRAPAEFKGEDSFAVTLAGVERGIRGATTVRVRVTVR